MPDIPNPRVRARRSDAARNDDKILAAAREVFTELGADAPVSVIASRAGVGMNSLYRRWASKDDLIRELVIDSMNFIRVAAERALAENAAWPAFVEFVHTCVRAGINGSPRLTGTYAVTCEVIAASKSGRETVQCLVERTQAQGGLRADINAHDIVLLVSELRYQQAAKALRPPGLQERLVAIVLDGLHIENPRPLPAAPATWDDIAAAWSTSDDT